MQIFHHLLPRKGVTKILLFSQGILANISLVICSLLFETCMTHDMPYALKNLEMAEFFEQMNDINDFCDICSILYMENSIHHKSCFFLKVINIFHSVNLILSYLWFSASTASQKRQETTTKLKTKRSLF